MIESIDHNKCTGCKMCADACPFSAISYKIDKRGFWFPIVDNEKCKKCKVCLKKCPALNKELQLIDKLSTPKIFALWTKDTKMRLESTSGGAFWEFGKYIIENNGYVIGSIYSNDWKSAHHFIGHNIEDLLKIKGSKYFQSDTANIFKTAKELILSNKPVLFVGTPCQIAALKSYLGKEYSNLILMDFICRGINSPLPFKRFIECLEKKYKSKTIFVQLKNKKTGWQSLGTYVKMENGNEYHQDKWHNDIWVKGFLDKNLYMRNSCHQCKYRNIPHGSDITLGDFWGITNVSKEDLFNGISSMMINTKKGFELFNKISNKFVVKEKYYDELLAGNPALINNPQKASEREKNKFFKKMDKYDFEYAINSLKERKIKKIIKFMKKLIKKFLKVAKKIVHFYKTYNLLKFIKLNFFSKNISREKGCYIIPCKNSNIIIDKTAKLIIKGRSIVIGFNKPKFSHYETLLKMEKNSVWFSENGATIFYNVNIELKPNSKLTTGFFSINSGSTIITSKEIEFGEDVMMGRNIIIYDSDFHQMINVNGTISNPSKKVTIEDHVWLVNNIVVLKGVTIGNNSLISSFVTIKKDVPAHSVVSNGTKNSVHEFVGNWNRESVR